MLGHFIPCVDIVINSHTLSSDIPRRDFISKRPTFRFLQIHSPRRGCVLERKKTRQYNFESSQSDIDNRPVWD